ncbi:MAG: hypothetical protein B0D92_08695 [Spirochaeta sp. LUC14_002_19_P3]|nr:MAG: hypothetical protein B0D92_08695 [Spirochaeta sp. LUC14_002_19_P3]
MLVSFFLTGAVLAGIGISLISLFACKHFYRLRIEQELTDLLGREQYQFTIIDVRDSQDFEQSHIERARNMPFSRTSDFFPSENMFERIIVFGPSDKAARAAARRISMNGYFNVSSYGAYRHWKGSKS